MFNKLQKAIVLGVGVFALGLFQSASADWFENNGVNFHENRQDIVVTLKSNPIANLEQACLSITFARMLEDKGHNATLFVTLDGVALAKDQGNRASRRMCTTPWGEVSLIENLKEFLDGDDTKMVVCPLCWVERYGLDESYDDPQPFEPDYGVLPGLTAAGDAIAVMIGNAEKILDF